MNRPHRPPRPAGPRAVLVFDGMCRCHWVAVLLAPEHRCRMIERLVAGTRNDPRTAETWPELWARLLTVDEAIRELERTRRNM